MYKPQALIYFIEFLYYRPTQTLDFHLAGPSDQIGTKFHIYYIIIYCVLHLCMPFSDMNITLWGSHAPAPPLKNAGDAPVNMSSIYS